MFNINFPDFSSSLFSTTYCCYSHSFIPGRIREGIDNGGKIIMPPSALEILTRLNIQYPMLFKLTNRLTHRHTHCGVLEFVADEGNIYVPYWMLRNLLLEEGDRVLVTSVGLPVASFAKFQPQCTSFLDISNPKAVLENALRSFACLTAGDIIAISYNARIYELKVLELKPAEAVSIIECDMSVEFAPALGYVEPTKENQNTKDNVNIDENAEFIPVMTQNFQVFSGIGHRLSGRQFGPNYHESASSIDVTPEKRGIPNYDYQPGSLTFLRFTNKANNPVEKEQEDSFKPFFGGGNKLRHKASVGT